MGSDYKSEGRSPRREIRLASISPEDPFDHPSPNLASTALTVTYEHNTVHFYLQGVLEALGIHLPFGYLDTAPFLKLDSTSTTILFTRELLTKSGFKNTEMFRFTNL